MKRENIEFIVGWLETLRRDDRQALLATLDTGVVWQGLKDEWLCRGPDEVADVFTARRDEAREVDAIDGAFPPRSRPLNPLSATDPDRRERAARPVDRSSSQAGGTR